jgi:hypothetical protein
MNLVSVHVQIDYEHVREVDSCYSKIEALVCPHHKKLVWVGTDEVPDAVEAEDPASAEVCPRILPLEPYVFPLMREKLVWEGLTLKHH